MIYVQFSIDDSKSLISTNEEGDQVNSLEPDPRYIRCCSAVCRPGYALRDALLGLLVLLGLAVVVTVIFVVCFYVVPNDKQLTEDGILPGKAEGVIGSPIDVNEVALQNEDKYNISRLEISNPSEEFRVPDTQEANIDKKSLDIKLFIDANNSDHQNLEPRENFDSPLPEPNDDQQEDDQQLHQQSNNEQEQEGHNLGHNGELPVRPSDEQDRFHRDDLTDQNHNNNNHNNHHAGTNISDDGNVDYVNLPVEGQHACGPVQLPMCVSSVPWSSTGLPNWLNHNSEGAMFAALPYVRSGLLDSGCSSLAPLYACSVLEPPCGGGVVLPPCRAFCAEVAEACQSFVQGVSLPGLFDCGRFPDSQDPSVCVAARQGGSTLRRHRPPLSSTLSDFMGTTVKNDLIPTTKKSLITTFTLNTGINFSDAEDSMPTTITPEFQTNEITTSNKLINSHDTTLESLLPTQMSLAQRLQLARSSAASAKITTERVQRHSHSPNIQTLHAENSNPTVMSLADRLTSGTTKKLQKIETTVSPRTFSKSTELPSRVTTTQFLFVSDDSSGNRNNGVLSLAELLAMSKPSNPSSRPAHRTQPRKSTGSLNNRNLIDQVTGETVATTQRVFATSRRTRFREVSNPSLQIVTGEDEDASTARRIPVRTVGQVPKMKFPFPRRTTDNRQTSFRTTEEPPTTQSPTTPSIPQTTSPTSTTERFIPSLTTKTIATFVTEAPGLSCPELQCLDGKCILISQLNDGAIDCSDGSDEHDFGGLVT